MELYEHARPDLLKGKKLLYVHGFASSGQSGTVRALRTLLPETEVIAPDVPVDLTGAIPMLQDLCASQRPDVILGTSMGGMLAEQLCGYDRILVNPAFTLADTILKNNGLGRQEFHNPRADGETSFMVTKGLLEGFRTVTDRAFSGDTTAEAQRVFGLFGLHDTLVNCFDLFAAHYPQAIHFDGEHSLNEKTLLTSVLPLLQRIDDRQRGLSRRTLLLDLDGVLRSRSVDRGEVAKALRKLETLYDLYILTGRSHYDTAGYAEAAAWCDETLGVTAWRRLIQTPRPELLAADYWLRSPESGPAPDSFMGTALTFGKDPLRVWADVLEFFTRLGGQ